MGASKCPICSADEVTPSGRLAKSSRNWKAQVSQLCGLAARSDASETMALGDIGMYGKEERLRLLSSYTPVNISASKGLRVIIGAEFRHR